MSDCIYIFHYMCRFVLRPSLIHLDIRLMILHSPLILNMLNIRLRDPFNILMSDWFNILNICLVFWVYVVVYDFLRILGLCCGTRFLYVM